MRLRHLFILIIVIAAYSGALIFASVVVTLAFRPKTIYKIAPVAIATLDAGPSPESFDPAYYGLPDTIAGYKILAVETYENFACIQPGTIQLVLQSSQPNLDAFLKNNPGGGVQQELNKLTLKPKQWGLQYVGTGISKATVLYVAKQANPRNKGLCVTLGGPRPTFTPSTP